MIKKFKQFKEGFYVDHKGNLISDERDQKSYVHSPDADAKLMHIASMYKDPTFERNLFDHVLNRKFDVSISEHDAYNSLASAIRDKIIDERDLKAIYELVNSKDLDVRTETHTKLIQYLDDLRKEKNYNFEKFKNNIAKSYRLEMQPSFIDTMTHAIETGQIDIIDLRNLYNMCESPIYYKNNEAKEIKSSGYENLSDDVEVYAKEGEEIKKLDTEEFEILKVIDVLSPKEVEKIHEMQVLNLGTTMPKDLKRGDELYLTVMLQPKSKVSSYNVNNMMGVVKVRVTDIYNGLGILKSKGLM